MRGVLAALRRGSTPVRACGRGGGAERTQELSQVAFVPPFVDLWTLECKYGSAKWDVIFDQAPTDHLRKLLLSCAYTTRSVG